MNKGFETCAHRPNGFHITFENGLTASVQWGIGTYSDNHYNPCFDFTKFLPSDTAEFAVIRNNEFVDDIDDFLPESCQYHSDGQVCGYLTPDDVAEFLSKVAAWHE